MNVNQILESALARVMDHSSGTLVANGTSITVYKSYLKTRNRQARDTNYFDSYDDVMVIGYVDDMNSLNIVPEQTNVTLDGDPYIAGQTMTSTPGYVSLWLRKKA